jgi:hypothetical protein
VRGIERTQIFRDDTDRADFVARLATLVEVQALTIYAGALLSNHAYVLPASEPPAQMGGSLALP